MIVTGPRTFASQLIEARNKSLYFGYLEDAIDTAEYMHREGCRHNDFIKTEQESSSWTAVANQYFSIDFYENSDGTKRITDATNVTIEFTDDIVPEKMCRGFDIFNTHIELVDEICGDLIERIIIKDLNPDELDEGYLFQLQSMHRVFPFELDLFKKIIRFAKTLKTDDDCLTI
jgi:hypothetical protein